MSNQECMNVFLDEFLEEYFLRRPVNASFIGRHEFDDKLPDFSKQGIIDTTNALNILLEKCKNIDEEGLDDQARIDKKIARGYLETQIWEFESNHFQNGNPAMYTGEAIFSLIVLFLTEYTSVEKRYEAFIKRVNIILDFFVNAEVNVQKAIPEWTKKAIKDCEGALAFLKKGLSRFIEKNPPPIPGDMEQAITIATNAFQNHKNHLENVLLTNKGGQYKAGKEAYELILRMGHFTNVNIENYLKYARRELEKSDAYLESNSKKIGVENLSEALKIIEQEHPKAEEYKDRFKILWDNCKSLSNQYKLLTWPDASIEYIEQYEWVKECSPYLYFLFYRSPAAFNHPNTHFYLIPNLEIEKWEQNEVEKFLRANNDYVIKTNHVAHHGSIGHHIQNNRAFAQNKSIIGKFAGCDCSNRPAMIQSGTMIEGWAVYASEMIGEYGYLTELEKYIDIQGYKRACCRAIVDIELHYGNFTLENATEFYMSNAGMSFDAAQSEAVKNSMFPGNAFVYLYGSNMIKSLKEKLMEKKGDSFVIGDFHDEFISYGSIPVDIVVEEFEKKYEILVKK